MVHDVLVPAVGESITEGFLAHWLVPEGALVQPETEIFELETDKVTLSVPAGFAGKLAIVVPAERDVRIGDVVARIDAAVQVAAEQPTPVPVPDVPPAPTPTTAPTSAPPSPPLEPPAGLPRAQARLAADASLSPAVRRLVEQHGVDPAGVASSGPHGRLTKGDVLAHLDARPDPPPAAPASPPVAEAPSTPPTQQRQERVRLPRLRARLAERLLRAQSEAAILTTFNEVDMSALMALRARHKEGFLKAQGVKLGMMSFFVRAVVGALQAVPALNGWIEGDELVRNHFWDIGVAVSTDRGLVVPVIRDAERKGLADIERDLAELAKKAREGRLELADLRGGVFTISNGGVFGSLLSTPILNPPQSGILGLHGIKKRPVVVTDEQGEDHIVARPMMYLALSYDHRVVDGKDAVTFLRHIVGCVEDPERLLLESCSGG